MQEKKIRLSLLITIAAVALLLIITVVGSFNVVNEGYVGVKTRFGEITEADLTPGLHWHIPFIEDIEPVDIREQVYMTNEACYTKDTQTVESMLVKLNYSYSPAMLTHLIQNVGIKTVEPVLIVPRVSSSLKNVTGKYRAEDLVQNRMAMQQEIMEILSESLEEYGIIVRSFAIENMEFESSFEQAIRLKVEAEQEALRVKNVTLTKQEEANQLVIKAKADADSAAIKVKQDAENARIAAEADAFATKTRKEAEAYGIELIQAQLAKGGTQYIEFIKASNWDGRWPSVMGNNVNPFINFDSSNASAGASSLYND